MGGHKDELDEWASQNLSESEVMGLQVQVILTALREVSERLVRKIDRMRYYDDIFTLEDAEGLNAELKRIGRDFT